MSSACIEFTGCKDARGYGRQTVDGVSDRAHRHSYRKHHGPIPKDMVVRHTCDNPPCINPDHLVLGTQLDNMQDAVKRKRFPDRRGAANDNSRLSVEQVIEIKRALQEPYWGIVRHLAAKYKVPESTITNIKIGRTWTSVSLE